MKSQGKRGGVKRRDFIASATSAGLAAGTIKTPAQASSQGERQLAGSMKASPPAEAQLAEEFDPLTEYSPADALRYFVERPASDFMVDTIRSLGIEYLVINAASSFRGLHESILNYGGNTKPEIITCLHEEQAVALAHGYYKVSGKPLAIACHGTVGLQHAAMAVYNAWSDKVPMILIGGNHRDAVSRRVPAEWVHSAQDPVRVIRDYIKWDDSPVSLSHFSESFVRAYRIATTPPMGPVAISLDAELQEASIDENVDLTIPSLSNAVPPRGDGSAVEEAARILVDAESPVIVVDRAIHSASGLTLMTNLAEALQAPVLDRGGRLNFPTNHYLNHTWRASAALRDADVVIGLELTDVWGAVRRMLDLPHREEASRIAEDAKVITIGLGDTFIKSNYQNFGRYYAADLSIIGDVEATLPSLIDAIRQQTSRSRRAIIAARQPWLRDAFEEMRNQSLDSARYGWAASPVSTARICMELWSHIRELDWGLVSGVGFWNNWPRRLWNMTEPHHYIGTSGAGGLGYGAPAAVGAALAHKAAGRIAINLQSDGDLLYAPGALWTAAHHSAPMLTVMHNNRAYHQEVMHVQRMASRRQRGLDGAAKIGNVFEDPFVDFASLAKSFGVWAEGPIEDPDELGPALRRAIEVVVNGQPALVDVVAQPR